MLILLVVLLAQGECHAADNNLPSLAVQKGKAYLHVREKTNHNDAPEIDRMLAYLGLPKGLSWCAAYSLTCYKDAADELRIKQPFPKYGRVAMLWSACQRNPLRYRAITSDEVRLGSVRLQPGDLPIFSHGATKNGDFNGHTGLVVNQISNTEMQTIEGNTSSGDAGNQREGNGVFIRYRKISPGTFKIIGFCRPR